MSNGNYTLTYRNFRHFDRQSLRNDISSQSWESVYAFCDPNEMWQEWKHVFLAIANKDAPLMTKRDTLEIKATKSNASNNWMLAKDNGMYLTKK